MRNGKPNPKTYPWWPEVIRLLEGNWIVQLGIQGEEPLVKDCRFNLPLKELSHLVAQCDTWISVDSFLPHLAHLVGKPGIVIFSASDPKIFGYPENVNLLKDRKYLRANQFEWWEATSFVEESFVKPEIVCSALSNIFQ